MAGRRAACFRGSAPFDQQTAPANRTYRRAYPASASASPPTELRFR